MRFETGEAAGLFYLSFVLESTIGDSCGCSRLWS
uniref:Uncharacterized protein n=1 Tax=Siphoviridae sp. ctuUw41 TaxID=2826503 RepID=A0A8S5MYJ5_9CAUD|nr:MAG TPA: hypothetical protein [Siphoviridae sp. ctuUw41]